VLFDLGETLLSFGRVSASRIFRKGARLSYDYLKSLDQPVGSFAVYKLKNFVALRTKHLLSTVKRRDFDALELLRDIGTKAGYNLTDEQWEQLVWLWYQPLSEKGAAEPDIVETLTRLRESGLKLGILSNTFVHGSSLDRHLAEAGILDFFPLRMYSYQFTFRKPDLRIFEAAAERIGHTPAEIMFVGDRIDNDVRPATKLGMTAVLKRTYANGAVKLPAEAYQVQLLSELPALIEKIRPSKGQTAGNPVKPVEHVRSA
jgi:HAD superfamily hydrolase (TIGR01549 family)